MKEIKAEDFPIELNQVNIGILVKMMESMPPSEEWRKISEILHFEQEVLIWDRASELNHLKEKKRWNSLTKKEQEKEKREIEESINDNSTKFRGNLFQQEIDSINISKLKEIKE